MTDFRRVDQLRERLGALRPLNQAEITRLREEFLVENTYNSNAIEGNSLSLRETAFVLLQGMTIAEKPLKDHLEAIGHKEAFEFVLELADSQSELCESVIKQIHSLVLLNDRLNAGKYRSVPVTILGAAHTPPQPYLIVPQMEQLLANYCGARADKVQSKKHIIEIVAEFHLNFECIHPFIDGNGRTGRLILNLELIKAGFLPINIKFADRRRYYDCFDRFYTDKTPAALSALIADYEVEELDKYIAIVEGASRE